MHTIEESKKKLGIRKSPTLASATPLIPSTPTKRTMLHELNPCNIILNITKNMNLKYSEMFSKIKSRISISAIAPHLLFSSYLCFFSYFIC